MKVPLFYVLLALCFTGIANAMSGGTSTKEVCKAVKKCTKLLEKDMECPVTPVLKKSLLNPVEPPFKLTLLRKGVWLYEDGTYLSLVLNVGKRVALIDIPDSPGSNKPDGSMTRLTDVTEQILNGKVPSRIDIVYSHAHFDHIGGTTRYVNYAKENYPDTKLVVWGTEESKRLVEKSVTKRAVVPDVIVGEKGATLSMGKGLNVRIILVGGHTFSDLAVYIPRTKKEDGILMYVDVVFPGWTPPFNLAITVSVGDYIAAQKELLKLDFDVFVGGHTSAGTKKDVKLNLEYTLDLVEASKKAIASITFEDFNEAGFGKFTDPTAPEFGNIWFAFINVQRRLEIDACYRIIYPKWGCRLSGIDFTLRGHCFTVISYLLVEY